MKTITRFTGAVTFVSILCISLSQCKSPGPQKTEAEVPETEVTDTAPAIADKEKGIVPLTLTVTNLKSPDAPVEVSIYKKAATFLDKDAQLKKFRFKPVNGKLTVALAGIRYGHFAIALYQDLNSDGVIDKSMLGIPTEPYAFSNDFRPTIKKPSFDNCKFEYSAKASNISIKLQK